jgi:signal transduction histidine kinase
VCIQPPNVEFRKIIVFIANVLSLLRTMIARNNLKIRLNMLFIGLSAAVVVACGLVYYSLNVQSSYTSKLSLSTRQKAIAEELGRKVLDLHDKAIANQDVTNDVQEIKVIFSKWENAQKALLTGSESYGTLRANSNDVQAMLQTNSSSFVLTRDFVEAFLQAPASFDKTKLREAFNTLDTYVDGMNNVTGRYLSESKIYQNLTFGAFAILIAIALVLLVGGAILVIKPIRKSLDEVEEELDMMEEKIAKADSAKTEFLSNMSHEIRTPLNGVLGMTELLTQTRMDEEQRSYVRNIQISSRNLLELLNNVLDVSKLQSGKMELHKERFALSDCIDQVIDLMKPLAQSKKIELMSDISPEVPMEIVQDENRLRQVLINLVNNAIKFTEKGEVVLSVDLVNKEGDFAQIELSVKDTGIGIEENVIENIFQSFYQAEASINKKYGGSGLGLAISKNLVHEMGGRIHVDSKPGVGSTFSFSIVAEISGAAQNAKIEALNGLRALIVDDNKTNLKILVKQLSVWGIQATPFNSPELVSEIVSNLRKFDFIIMDMQMPEMDGRSLSEKIRSRYSMTELPIIVLSSLGENLLLIQKIFTTPISPNR